MYYRIEQDNVVVALEDDGGVIGGYGGNYSARKISVVLGKQEKSETLDDYYYLASLGRTPKQEPYNNITLTRINIRNKGKTQIIEVFCKTQDEKRPQRSFSFKFKKQN